MTTNLENFKIFFNQKSHKTVLNYKKNHTNVPVWWTDRPPSVSAPSSASAWWRWASSCRTPTRSPCPQAPSWPWSEWFPSCTASPAGPAWCAPWTGLSGRGLLSAWPSRGSPCWVCCTWKLVVNYKKLFQHWLRRKNIYCFPARL